MRWNWPGGAGPVSALVLVIALSVASTLGHSDTVAPESVGSSASSSSGVLSSETSRSSSIPSPTAYAAPVDALVKDPFRMDNGPFGSGNRGLEYATLGGESVCAPVSGIVSFAGSVARRNVITIRSSDGRLVSLTNMASIRVRIGEPVLLKERIGKSAVGLHFSVREAGRYIDPARLLAKGMPKCESTRRTGHSYLVPTRRDRD
ncbi:MAG: M23 family metallopeptidase [Microthrixaceae bacterium]